MTVHSHNPFTCGILCFQGEYSNEMSVVGIIPKGGEANDYVVGEQFRVCLNTKVRFPFSG